MDIKQARIILKNHRIKPNRSEQKLLDLLEYYFPGKFMYNGGQITIEGKIPDFININERKVIIELVGRRDFPKHSEEELEDRKAMFAKYGFRTLYVYQEDLRDREDLFQTILFFTYKGIG